MDHRFSIVRVEGVDNDGLQMSERCCSKPDATGDYVNTTSTTCLYDITTEADKRKKSLAQYTREAFPRLENYRNSRRAFKRPSLAQLHAGDESAKVNLFLEIFFIILLLKKMIFEIFLS